MKNIRHLKRLDKKMKLPYLFDCKPWLIKFFFIISCGLRSRVAYIFLNLIERSQFTTFTCDAQPFLGYVLPTKLFLNYLLFSITPSQERLWWIEGNCGGVNVITRVGKNTKRASMQNYVRGVVNLYLSAAYDQGAWCGRILGCMQYVRALC